MLRGQVLVQRAAQQNVYQLDTAADAQHGLALRHGQAEQPRLQRVPPRAEDTAQGRGSLSI